MVVTSKAKISDKGIFGFTKILLRGAAQVMFQSSAWCGLLFLVGIFWGAYASGTPLVAWGALLGLLISTITGFILNLPDDEGENGLWGFNGILVGCALPTFLGNNIWMWLSLVLCAALTTWVRTGMNNMMKQWKINSFTFPFVASTWVFLLAAHAMNGLMNTHELHHAAHDHMQHLHHLYYTGSLWDMAVYMMRGVSQVFLIDEWITGAFFLLGLLVSNRWAFLWAVVGSALASFTAFALGASMSHITQGLYAFSAVLTAIALGSTFYRPCWRTALWSLLGIITTVFVQAAMNSMMPLGIATLTAPFCLTTWIFLLPMFKLDKQTADHTSWHTRKR